MNSESSTVLVATMTELSSRTPISSRAQYGFYWFRLDPPSPRAPWLARSRGSG